ncbi:MAG: hypothetical protein HKN91_05335 [Acidimicrobiia bacterium]|nr:hypothetical protein [Acidimicrobiia bacterium]
MHESRLVGQLLDEAERRADGSITTIRGLRFEIGAMAAVSDVGLRHGAADAARERWGFAPTIEVDESHDPLDSGAQGVKLVAIMVGDG